MEWSGSRPSEDKDAAISPTDPITDNSLENNSDAVSETVDAPIIAELTPNIPVGTMSIRGLRKVITERRLDRLVVRQAKLSHELNTRKTISESALGLPFDSSVDKNAAALMPSSNRERKHANKTDKSLGKTLERGIAMQMLTQTIGIDGVPLNSKGYKAAIDSTNLTGKEKRGSIRGSRAYKRASKRMSRNRDLLTEEASGSDKSGIVVADRLSKVADKSVRVHSRLIAD